MCAILDASCLHKVFGEENRPEAGVKFFEWLESRGTLVVGGNLLKELSQNNRFSEWYKQAILAGSGKVIRIEDVRVDKQTVILQNSESCKSNDEHIVALAQVSKARMLYSDDGDLHKDFGNSNLINNPRGKIYSTKIDDKFNQTHSKLHGNRNLCRF